ncbi:Alpha-crystallin B chain [Frankliniella fusca]|uniref:Alpha-crystallin B chain n=1 Tax=Frankliniella fusca TaxID=407009 RepID=A0AAE1LT74_9NEOP|nr:Alpha-crystallin B chain [Frankliniella fusca]
MSLVPALSTELDNWRPFRRSSTWDLLDRPLKDDWHWYDRDRPYWMRPWRLYEAALNGLSEFTEDKENYMVNLDVGPFRPSEVKVKAENNYLTVEGKHEERPDNASGGYTKRLFVRRYHLPDNVNPGRVTANLSSDGVLMITAPKSWYRSGFTHERSIPITQTYLPALKYKRKWT